MINIINEQISEKKVIVIDSEGNNLGLKNTSDALRLAQKAGLDLVVMQNKTQPFVCKIMDYNRAVYEQKKKDKERKKAQKTVEIKNIQLSYRIDVGDFDRKVEKAREELMRGNKIYVTLRLRGREISYAAVALNVVKRFCSALSDTAILSKQPLLDGKTISATLEGKR